MPGLVSSYFSPDRDLKTEGPPVTLERLETVGGMPLGVMYGVEYENQAVELQPGQTLVYYSDGITEALSPKGRMFGVQGIERSLTECTGEPDCVINHITDTLKEHEKGVRPNDDQTIVVMRVE